MSDSAERFAYVGLCAACRQPFAVSADQPSMRESNAEFVADLIRRGATVERWTSARVREGPEWCNCPPTSELPHG